MTALEFNELTCDETLELLSASFDGESAEHKLEAVATHLLTCAECRIMAEAMEEDDALLRDAMGGLQRSSSPSRWRPLAWGIGLAAAALFAVGVWRIGPTKPLVERSMEPVAETVDVPVDDAGLEARLADVQAQIEALEAGHELPSTPAISPRTNPFRSPRANPFANSTSHTGLSSSPFARSSIFDSKQRTRRFSGSSI